MTISVYGGKNECLKNVLKNPNVRTILGCLDKMSKVNISPAETLYNPKPLMPNIKMNAKFEENLSKINKFRDRREK